MAFPTRFDALIQDAANRASVLGAVVDPRLVKAIVAKESAFDPDAVNGEAHLQDASIGLMQVLYATAVKYRPGISPAQLREPAVNLEVGTKYLADLLRRAGGDWWRAVSAYNGGWRPELGFGTVLTAPKRICLDWKDGAPTTGRVLDRDCKTIYEAKAGEFGNQPYVLAVARNVNQVAKEWAGLAGGGAAERSRIVFSLLLLGGGYGLYRVITQGGFRA